MTGADVTTLNSIDTIDGGAGSDTLNIEVKTVTVDNVATTCNASLQGSIKNVETINIDNTRPLNSWTSPCYATFITGSIAAYSWPEPAIGALHIFDG